MIYVGRHAEMPLLQRGDPAKAGAAVGPAAPVPRAMPACAGMTAEGHPYFLSSSTSENSASTTSSSALLSPASAAGDAAARSEEHTSELQSLMRISYAVFCLKKKKNNKT